jgi:hypothetical protein
MATGSRAAKSGEMRREDLGTSGGIVEWRSGFIFSVVGFGLFCLPVPHPFDLRFSGNQAMQTLDGTASYARRFRSSIMHFRPKSSHDCISHKAPGFSRPVRRKAAPGGVWHSWASFFHQSGEKTKISSGNREKTNLSGPQDNLGAEGN